MDLPRNRPVRGPPRLVMSKQLTPPAAAGAIVGRAHPKFENGPRGEFRYTMTEELQPINTASAAFLGLNQALIPSTFPWGAGLAINFSKYRFLKLRYIYIPMCSVNTPGGLTLGVEYETSDSTPTTLAQASALFGAVSSAYWGGIEGTAMLGDINRVANGAVYVDVDVKRAQKPWYPFTTSTNYAASTVKNTFSMGQVVAVCDGGPTPNVAAGRIYVQYRIELVEPIPSALNA